VTDAEQCQALVTYYGGWDFVPAQTAAAIAEKCGGLLPSFIEAAGQFGSILKSQYPDYRATGYSDVAEWILSAAGDLLTGPQGGVVDPSWPGLPGAGIGQLEAAQYPITTGAQGSTALCWQPSNDPDTIRRRYARRRIRQVKVRDTTSPGGWHWELREGCAPRRMNYCNSRALGRAARRLGGFQALAATVEKVIQRSLKRKVVRRASGFTKRRTC